MEQKCIRNSVSTKETYEVVMRERERGREVIQVGNTFVNKISVVVGSKQEGKQASR